MKEEEVQSYLVEEVAAYPLVEEEEVQVGHWSSWEELILRFNIIIEFTYSGLRPRSVPVDAFTPEGFPLRVPID